MAAFGAEDRMAQLYDARCQIPIASGVRKGQISGLGLGFSNFTLFGVYALAFWYGGQLVKQGHATFKQVFQVTHSHPVCVLGILVGSGGILRGFRAFQGFGFFEISVVLRV